MGSREHSAGEEPHRSVYALKQTLDHWYQRHGSACYLGESDFADVLRRCGHVVKNGDVRIAEITE